MSVVRKTKSFPGGQRLELALGDITLEAVDAIVNAANANLQHGGGVAYAIVRRGGAIIQQESNRWVKQHGAVPHDHPAYTTAGALPCKYVIHAVGPAWGEGNEEAKLEAAVRGSLKLADELGLHSLALPAISTGIFGFPTDRAARIILAAIQQYFEKNPHSELMLVRIVLFENEKLEIFLDVMEAGGFP